jgi:general secretion pathway protein G
MSRSKVVLALLFFLGGAAALWFAHREISRGATDPSLRAMRKLGAIQMAIERFQMDTGTYPTTRDGLGALLHRPYSLTSGVWHGPYMDLAHGGSLRDPWGRPYEYRITAGGRGTAVTLGADGRPGGMGPARDLSGTPLDDAGTAAAGSR